jgi:hypothetical protein
MRLRRRTQKVRVRRSEAACTGALVVVHGEAQAAPTEQNLTESQRAVLVEVAQAAATLRLRREQPSPKRLSSEGLERSPSGNRLVRSAEAGRAQGSRIIDLPYTVDELSKADLLRCPTCEDSIVAIAHGEQHRGVGGAIALCCTGCARCRNTTFHISTSQPVPVRTHEHDGVPTP